MAGATTEQQPLNAADQLEASVDAVVAICGGDQRAALRALVAANEYLNNELERLEAMISRGYARFARNGGT